MVMDATPNAQIAAAAKATPVADATVQASITRRIPDSCLLRKASEVLTLSVNFNPGWVPPAPRAQSSAAPAAHPSLKHIAAEALGATHIPEFRFGPLQIGIIPIPGQDLKALCLARLQSVSKMTVGPLNLKVPVGTLSMMVGTLETKEETGSLGMF